MDHLEYISRKQNNTIRLYNEQMIHGKIFKNTRIDEIDSLTGTFADFEKPSTIKPNPKVGKNAKESENNPTNVTDIQLQKLVHCLDKEVSQ